VYQENNNTYIDDKGSIMITTNLPRLSAVLIACAFAWIASATPVRANTVGIQQIAFSTNSAQILYITNRFGQGQRSRKPVIRFIHSQSGMPMRSTTLALNPYKQLIMGFTPDGFKLSVLEDKGLSILHNQTGKTLRTMPVPNLPVPAVRYRPIQAINNLSGTQQVFKAFRKDQLNIIHTGTGKLIATVDLPSRFYRASGMSEDGRLVAYLMRGDNTQHELHLYDVFTKKAKTTLYIPNDGKKPQNGPIVLSPDGKFAVAESTLIDLTTSRSILLPEAVRLPIDSTAAIPAIFTANKRYLLLPQKNNTMIRFDLVTKQQHPINFKLPGHCKSATAYDRSPNGAWIALGHQCNVGREKADYISLLNAKTGQFIRNLQPLPEKK